MSVWCPPNTSASVVHYSFLKSGQTTTTGICCQQMQTMMEELAAKHRGWSIALGTTASGQR